MVNSGLMIYCFSINCLSFSAFSGFSFLTVSMMRFLIFSSVRLASNVSHLADFFLICVVCSSLVVDLLLELAC